VNARVSTVLRALATGGAVAVLVRLSAWQWERGAARGSLLNFTYAVEWALAAVALVGVVLLRRHRGASRPRSDGSRGVDGRVIGPPLRPGEQLAPPTSVQVQQWLRRHR
jgi:hypothetical protein